MSKFHSKKTMEGKKQGNCQGKIFEILFDKNVQLDSIFYLKQYKESINYLKFLQNDGSCFKVGNEGSNVDFYDGLLKYTFPLNTSIFQIKTQFFNNKMNLLKFVFTNDSIKLE